MNRFTNKLILAIFLLFSFGITPAQAKIKIGTVFFDPPFVMAPGQGFNYDLIATICKGLQEDCQIQQMDFGTLFTAVTNGRVDLAVGISIDSQRKNNFIFSLPYMLSKAQFMISTNNKVKTIANLQNGKIGIIKEDQNGILYNYLMSQSTYQFKIVTFDDIEDLITGLNENTINAAFIHAPSLAYWVQNSDGQFAALGAPVTLGEGIAFMGLANQQALIQSINQQLQKMETDNAYLNLYKNYFSS
ncbi:transporter substrate-binding domain-containing protein [Legionella dresdenensis]|uniref:Transporter substrate-binding domain-containing protein n=1 Tax=Legionella dresdenensis TaxID=450200 RepID=A0ABV8CC54_9GAMM